MSRCTLASGSRYRRARDVGLQDMPPEVLFEIFEKATTNRVEEALWRRVCRDFARFSKVGQKHKRVSARKILIHACRTASLSVTKYAIDSLLLAGKQELESPSRYNKMELDHSLKLGFLESCRYGNLDVCVYLRGNDTSLNDVLPSAFHYACSNGHLNVAQWLYALKKPAFDRASFLNTLSQACMANHLNVVQWLFSKSKKTLRGRLSDELSLALESAYTGKSLSVIDWITMHKEMTMQSVISAQERAFKFCCANGRLDSAQYIFRLGKVGLAPQNFVYYLHACQNGHLHVAQWLRSLVVFHIDMLRLETCFEIVISKNDLAMAQWMHAVENVTPSASVVIQVEMTYLKDQRFEAMMLWIQSIS